MSVTGLASTLLTTLAKAASSAAQMNTTIQLDHIKAQIEKQLKAKIAALKDPTDTVVIQSRQSVLDGLKQQFAATNTIAGQFAANGNVFSDLSSQLATLQDAITAGDATGFNQKLVMANNDLHNLINISPTAPYQDSNVEQFKTNGLGIKNATDYDLTTPAGKAAAQADVQNAQQTVLALTAVGTSNQLVAYSNSNDIASRIDPLAASIQKMKNSNEDYIAIQTAQLTQLAQTQQHLIQLGLGNTTQLSSVLTKMTATATIASSPYDVLGTAATTGGSSNSAPAVLSLLT